LTAKRIKNLAAEFVAETGTLDHRRLQQEDRIRRAATKGTASYERTSMLARLVTLFRRMFISVGALPLLLVLLIIFFATQNPRFLSEVNILNITQQGIYLLLISLAQMMVLVSGGFDLSVGANVALTSIGSATIMAGVFGASPDQATLAIVAGFAAAIAIGLGCGLANGIGVSYLNVNPFIVTLATASVIQGLTLLISQGQEVSGLPRQFVRQIGSGLFLDIPIAVLLSLPVIVALYLLMARSRYGRYVYAIGSNPKAALVAGVRIPLTLLITYVICGVVTAYSSFLLTARVSAGEPLLGAEFPLQSITAAILGGCSLRGGQGGVGGAIVGAIFVTVLANGMDLMRLGSNHQLIILGFLLVIAVLLDRERTKLGYASMSASVRKVGSTHGAQISGR
jgi:ribose/xylose/arabinose/galactoside ABC-type transport system permease subunit